MTWEGDPRTSTPAWRRLRKQILERDGYRCTWVDDGCRCAERAVEVDHVENAKSGGSDDPSNLRSLCAKHHARKTAAEGNAARWRFRRRRPPPPHPGVIAPRGSGR